MHMRHLAQAILGSASAWVLALSPTSASILTFEQDLPVSNFENINQLYGDRVILTNDVVNNFQYGVGSEGFTPNVVLTYGPNAADPALWTTGYGDLSNVLFKDADGVAQLDVTFTPDAGFAVQLYGFDMAAFSSAFSGNPTINFVQVTDGVGNVLFRQDNAVISETTRTSFDFSASPLTASTLVLSFDSINLGGLSDDIAFDNIRFGQVLIPEPTGVAALLAVPALLTRRRR